MTEFNALVDEYNAWVRQHFGEDANLLMSKIETTPLGGSQYLTKPLNASGDLSKFGKQQVYAANSQNAISGSNEYDISQQELNNF